MERHLTHEGGGRHLAAAAGREGRRRRRIAPGGRRTRCSVDVAKQPKQTEGARLPPQFPNAAQDTLPSRPPPPPLDVLELHQTETRAESWLVAVGGVRLAVVV
ncbi:hypothetical protein CSOJ01_03770 [Colletotrichum sojae]|uniref:Uncharacterized protein n=1 Tax=Colletotrichum sojae TaxID=2175907 RepID=A0A8H6N0I4_9PEZI|nr:hypothetical protein CSOJ01_03770 [Colletotrichum sojae]